MVPDAQAACVNATIMEIAQAKSAVENTTSAMRPESATRLPAPGSHGACHEQQASVLNRENDR